MEGSVVTVSDLVMDRADQRIGWAVTATYAAVDGSEPRCIDYRVRVVPRGKPDESLASSIRAGNRALAAMVGSAMTPADVEALGEFPSAGIPGYVFRDASQARLLAKAREAIARKPERFAVPTRAAIQRTPVSRQREVRRGRPSSRSLGEKLRILEHLEREYAEGKPGARARVAAAHHMSEGALKMLVSWARHDAEPQLFTDVRAGQTGGRLTSAARDLMEGDDRG